MTSLFRSVGRTLAGRVLPRGTVLPVARGPLRGTRIVHGSLGGDGGGASVYLGLIEPEQTRVLADLLRPGADFVDIGANVGYYTLLGARRVGPTGRVWAVEPSVRNISYLHRHVTLNRMANVFVVTGACAEAPGLARFDRGATFAEGHIVHGGAADDGDADVVPTFSLDALVTRAGARPSVVKIDAEGAELQVLRGGQETLTSARPDVLLSVHSDSLRADCLALLDAFGYTTESLDPEDSQYLARARRGEHDGGRR